MPTIVDINQEARDLCDADTTSYPAATLLRRINQAYEQVVGWLINADGSWQFDDSNNTNLPIGTQTLVASQNAYTFNDKFLQILEVQIKDVNGNWQIIEPIDQKEFSDSTPLDEAFKTAGMPQYYDKVSDDTIKLYPAPSAANCTLASGLKIKFKRTAAIFTSAEVSTGTKVPGFASTYHYILSYMAAIPYCMSYKKDRVALYEKIVMDMKKELIELYSQREKDVRKIMTFKQRSYM
jgi:hypothetical protein